MTEKTVHVVRDFFPEKNLYILTGEYKEKYSAIVNSKVINKKLLDEVIKCALSSIFNITNSGSDTDVRYLNPEEEKYFSDFYRCIEKTVYFINENSNINQHYTKADFIAILVKNMFEIMNGEKGEDITFNFLILWGRRHVPQKEGGSLPGVRRRNGQVVPFMVNKIVRAIEKAYLSLGKTTYKQSIITSILDRITSLNKRVLDLEVIQDIVIEQLILNKEYDVARAYALYRAERAQERIHNLEKIKSKTCLHIEEPSGIMYYFSEEELDKIIEFASDGLDLILSKEEIKNYLMKSSYDGMKRNDFNKLLVMNAKSLMELDYDFTFFAARVFLLQIYEETMGWNIHRHGLEELNNFYKNLFSDYIRRGVEMGRLDPRLLEYNLDELADHFDYKYDIHFTYLGIQTLYDRYYITEKVGDKIMRIEAPQWFWMRVAMGIHILEKENKEKHVLELFDLYRRRLLCSSTPTLFNSGTIRPQLSSCYLYKVDDSIESIMQRGISDTAYLSKWAGGLGGSWTAVRGNGSYIKGTGGHSNGVIPFLKIHNDMLVAVNQGGKRSGSGCAYLEVWHNDIFDFLELRRNTGDERRRTHDMNTACWIPDLFMKRVMERGTWTLFRSNEVPDLHETYGILFEKKYIEYEKMAEEGLIYGQKIEALELWKQMLRMLFETGHPWMTFKDPCNIRSPQDHVGVVHSSNLCTEITLNTSEDEIAVCNLASIVLDNHADENGNIDYEQLAKTIRIAIRALDNVIDVNFYPVEAAKNSNMRHRPIGLGIMGWHYLLMKKNIPFDSQENVKISDELMEFIAYKAYEASSDLAVERGSYQTFKGSKWDRGLMPLDTIELLEKERQYKVDVNRESRMDWDALREKIKKQGMRNSNVLAIAPTATISNIMGTSPSIEPLYSNMYVKSNLSGDFVVINPYMCADLKKAGLWKKDTINLIKYYDGNLEHIKEIPQDIKNKYKTAFQIDWKVIIDAAAVRQKWIDQSQSLNLFLEVPDMKIMSHMYKYAWMKGLKTTYYLRTLGATSIEKSTVSKKDIKNDEEEIKPSVCYIGESGECESCQ